LVIGNNRELRDDTIKWMHNSSRGGHSGVNSTMKRVKAIVHWKGVSNDIKKFIHQLMQI